MTTLTTHLRKEGAGGSYVGHIKIGLNMVVWSLAVFATSLAHAIFPFAFENVSMNAAKKLASLVDETFSHHEN